MEKIQPPHSDSVAGASRKPPGGAAGSSRKPLDGAAGSSRKPLDGATGSSRKPLDGAAGSSRKPLDGAAGSSRKRSEMDVLRALEQSAILLDHLLARCQQGGGGLSVEEQRALAGNMSIVSNVLRFLGQNVVPSLLAAGAAGSALRQQATWEVLTRLARLTAELELCFKAPPATLN